MKLILHIGHDALVDAMTLARVAAVRLQVAWRRLTEAHLPAKLTDACVAPGAGIRCGIALAAIQVRCTEPRGAGRVPRRGAQVLSQHACVLLPLSNCLQGRFRPRRTVRAGESVLPDAVWVQALRVRLSLALAGHWRAWAARCLWRRVL
jgi:hypothetical protein